MQSLIHYIILNFTKIKHNAPRTGVDLHKGVQHKDTHECREQNDHKNHHALGTF